MAERREDESGARSVCTDQQQTLLRLSLLVQQNLQSRRSCCSRKEDTGRRQQSTGNSTSTTRTTAETTEQLNSCSQEGHQLELERMHQLSRDQASTNTAETQPSVTSMSKHWQERQVPCNANTQSRKSGEIQKVVGRNGIMAKDHNQMA